MQGNQINLHKQIYLDNLSDNQTFSGCLKLILKICSADNISLHLKNIFNDGELHKEATIEKISIVQKEGNRSVQRAIEYYNLDAIISVGYRVQRRVGNLLPTRFFRQPETIRNSCKT